VHRLELDPGDTTITYSASAESDGAPRPVRPADWAVALRPSRYCPSDQLEGFATTEFDRNLPRAELVAAVAEWVHRRLTYTSGSSRPVDTAVDTLLLGRGVCRDYAHLTVTLLRALEVPARLVAVYAPGLDPMDFHAVVEADVDGTWCVVDATRLAPTRSLLRICSGRDAADTAFLTTLGGVARFEGMTVTATAAGDLPVPDHTPFALA
jgi:transglutaminase-like putative cysteine protease